MKNEGEIRILPPEEARRIAAGEVIDRPSALVREFLDNAFDAGASQIEVIIEEGGIRRTEVVDDGGGMGKGDLELCSLAHATSKIRSMDDLKTSSTLGFRGEALAAAAAVSRLEILSSTNGKEAWKLTAGPGSGFHLEQSRRAKGTSVRSLGLFDTIPARKRFLKRPGSEATSCRFSFNEKALAFPGLTFRFTQDGILKTFLPPVPSLKARFCQIFLEEREGVFLHEIFTSGSGFSVSVVAGGPELFRRDRRLQFVFANSRRIQDFSLLQALEYGLQGWFPNGTHPVGAVFVTVDPALADFNIHPAKREVRFADQGAIHHAVSTALRNFAKMSPGTIFYKKNSHGGTESTEFHGGELEIFEPQNPCTSAPLRSLREDLGEKSINPETLAADALDVSFAAEGSVPYTADGRARYLGRLFGLFILVEKNDRLFIIDQHAAHERILYERFLRGPVTRQELLVAIPFGTDSPEADRFLEEKREEFTRLGIVFTRSGDLWLIEALPVGWKRSDGETVAEILSLRNAGENMAERWAATLACHTAVRDGDYLDEGTALAIAEEAFALPIHRCPHGRPIWTEIGREDLLRAVKRN